MEARSKRNSICALLDIRNAIFNASSILGTLIIIAKLDVSFFEANGMIVNNDLREAFYYQIFEIDPTSLIALSFGLVAVWAVSFIFSRSQTNYFRRLGDLLLDLSVHGESGDGTNMGSFTPWIERFTLTMGMRLKKASKEDIEAALKAAVKDWPSEAKVNWFDQIQFGLICGALAGLFSILCLTFFDALNERVIYLSSKLVRFHLTTGPQFFVEQLRITHFVSISILSVMSVSFVYLGFRHGRKMSQSTYSCLRDLRRFMEGNYRQRLLLRSGDLGKEHIPRINKALEKIQSRLT
jgi:hypothetical protein